MAYLNYTKEQKQALFDFYGNKCLCCGTTKKLTIDHVVPTALGGLDILQNIQPLCRSCNSTKHISSVDFRPVPYPDAPVIESPKIDDRIHYTLAMPPELLARVRKLAKQHYRSVNQEMIYLLTEYQDRQERQSAHDGPPFGD